MHFQVMVINIGMDYQLDVNMEQDLNAEILLKWN